MENPFRPGAGHQPPYLAGRDAEKVAFARLLEQKVVLKNLIISGLRGIGKTALLEELKSAAIAGNWRWTGTDCSEAATVSEESMAIRLITDLALITAGIKVGVVTVPGFGFAAPDEHRNQYLDYEYLVSLYKFVPGLVSDKLKAVLELVWQCLRQENCHGIVFAYDEAQILTDHAAESQYPLSLLLDIFQSVQKKNIPFMLVLTGLPTLLSNLVETRTYSERLFQVLTLEKLDRNSSRDAILKPIGKSDFSFTEQVVDTIVAESGGYPYFLQFICKEIFDIWLQQAALGKPLTVPMKTIIQKLDNDFFAGRWALATDREQELMLIIAKLHKPEFKVLDIAEGSKDGIQKSFSPSHINQILKRLSEHGLIYKNKRGSYSFAVPLLEQYILRQGEK